MNFGPYTVYQGKVTHGKKAEEISNIQIRSDLEENILRKFSDGRRHGGKEGRYRRCGSPSLIKNPMCGTASNLDRSLTLLFTCC
jgi:hypothetical protein